MIFRSSILIALLGFSILACGSSPTPSLTSQQADGETTTPAVVPPAATEPKPTSTLQTRERPDTTGESSVPAKPVASLATPEALLADYSFLGIADFLPDAPERDLYLLTEQLASSKPTDNRSVPPGSAPNYTPGRIDTFWLINLPELKNYQSDFELRHVTPHAYWYFEEGLSAKQADIEQAAAVFEEQIYPRVTSSFGLEWTPGIDNDPHINVLNAKLSGVGGYYSSTDEFPASVNKFSNQREIIYINSGAIPVGTQQYAETLAHELQHAIHWNIDSSEDTWVNEGLAELAVTVAGFEQASQFRFAFARPTSFVHWPLTPFGSAPSYGASSLFMHYLAEQYVDQNDLTGLIAEPKDGIAGINSYLQSSGHDVTFAEVFGDWAVANFLDEDQGRYGYSELEVESNPTRRLGDFSEVSSQMPQYSVEYVELGEDLISHDGALRLIFQGQAVSDLLPTEVGAEGCWWGNSGDSINATLTRTVDLSQLDSATLKYQVWFELETDWDYAYVEVSTDSGQTWEILRTPNTTSENPIGNSFGMGYTGNSGGWIDEKVDLSAFAGQQIQVRFQYVTDDAVNGSGICFRAISIPETGFSDTELLTSGPSDTAADWQADGFLRVSNQVKQEYIVQLIGSGTDNLVTRLELDDNNMGNLIIPVARPFQRMVVAVAALAPKTRIRTSYSLVVEPVR